MRFRFPPDHPLNQEPDEYVSADGVELKRTVGLAPGEPPTRRRRPGKYLREVLDDYERRLPRGSRATSDRAIPYLDRDGRWRR